MTPLKLLYLHFQYFHLYILSGKYFHFLFIGLYKSLIICVLCITALLYGCPPNEDIEPYCSCMDLSENTIMFCEDIMCPDHFTIPIKAIAKHHSNLYSLSIFNSSLLYVPDDIFKGTHIEQVNIYISTFQLRLFPLNRLILQ